MNKLAFLIALSVAMTACATGAGLTQQERSLLWVTDANPQLDAQNALARNDFRMMGMPQRSIIIPGVEKAKMSQYEIKCGVHIMEGVSDTILNENHLRLMKKAHSYALQYNAIIKTHCKP